MLPLTMNS